MEGRAQQLGTRFVIIAAPRTGSNHLCARLRAQPDVWCHGEVFHPKRVWIRIGTDVAQVDDKTEASLRNLRETDRAKFLEEVFASSPGRPNVGFKIFPGHGGDEITRLIADKGLAKIILWRDNFLAVYSSRLAAQVSGAYSAVDMSRSKRPTVVFDGAAFDSMRASYAAYSARCLRQLEATGQAFHRIAYSEINSPSRIGALLDFIGANPQMAEWAAPDVRGPSDILSRFSNPETAEAHLREHGLSHWAHEAT